MKTETPLQVLKTAELPPSVGAVLSPLCPQERCTPLPAGIGAEQAAARLAVHPPPCPPYFPNKSDAGPSSCDSCQDKYLECNHWKTLCLEPVQP